MSSLTIQHSKEQGSCTFSADGNQTRPQLGQRIVINPGGPQLFLGTVVHVDQDYEELPDQLRWEVTLMDTSWQLNARRPFGGWSETRINTIIAEIITNFAPEFTLTYVVTDLPHVTIEFDGGQDFASCLTALCNAASVNDVGAGLHWFLDDYDLHVFYEETADPPEPIVDGSPLLLHDPPIRMSEDLLQVRTRIYGQGGGATALTNVSPGSTSIQVDGFDAFDPSGGTVIVGSQVIRYHGNDTTYIPVDTGAPPTESPGTNATFHFDASVGDVADIGGVKGYVRYAVSFVREGIGESELSPSGNGSQQWSASYTNFMDLFGIHLDSEDGSSGNAPLLGNSYLFAYQMEDGSFSSWPALGFFGYNTPQFLVYGTITFSIGPGKGQLPGGGGLDPRITGIALFRKKWQGTRADQNFYHVTTVAVDATSIVDSLGDDELGSMMPVLVPDQPGLNMVGINVRVTLPIGDATVTARKVYRKFYGYMNFDVGPGIPGGGTEPEWQLLTTINDNTTDEYIDGAASSGGESPRPTPDPLVRLALTGIPSSGPGSIVRFIPAGSPVNLWAQEDDIDAQVALAISAGGTGVREDKFVDERILHITTLRNRLKALLALQGRSSKQVTYASRDPKSTVGQDVSINLTNPPIVGIFRITNVTIDQIHEADELIERYHVTASIGARFTFEDLVRRLTLQDPR